MQQNRETDVNKPPNGGDDRGHGATEQLSRITLDAKVASRGSGPTICWAAFESVRESRLNESLKPEANIDGIARSVFWNHGNQLPTLVAEFSELLFRSHVITSVTEVTSKFPFLHL
jgi:hypothetical protein